VIYCDHVLSECINYVYDLVIVTGVSPWREY